MFLLIHAQKSGGELSSVFAQSWRSCLCACASDVCVCVCLCVSVCVCFRCVRENFLHSARLLLQQSWASFVLALYLWAVLISSPDTWDWTRMHVLVVMHRRTLYENVDRAKIKVHFYTTDIDILHVASMNRYTPYIYIYIFNYYYYYWNFWNVQCIYFCN